MKIRQASKQDWPAIWSILRPVFRAGDTYAVDHDISEEAARHLWINIPAETFVAEDDDGVLLGTYYIKPNFQGGASHICNCGYVTSSTEQGKGIARIMCDHSQDVARDLGYRAMQFNLVLASNERAVALWHRLGFETVATLPGAFDHPTQGFVDAHVMWKRL